MHERPEDAHERLADAPERLMRRRSFLDRKLTAWLVLLVTAAVSVVAYRQAESERRRISQERFHLLARSAELVLLDRMKDYAEVLRSGAALFEASEEVTREEFRRYVRALRLDRYLPGIQAMGLVVMMPREARESHERAIRAEGFPDYAIFPEGDRDPLSAIVYIEPFDAMNRRAFGYDMYSEPVRRAAMDRARDRGRPALSGKVRLVQETEGQPGFLMYMPLYAHGRPLDSVEARREALVGFVYAPFRAFDLMHAAFAERTHDVDIELYDRAFAPENLLFDTRTDARKAEWSVDVPLVVAGRPWIARFHSTENFETSRASIQPKAILFGGLAFGLLMFAMLFANARHRHEIRLAAEALAANRDRYRALVENLPGTVFRASVTMPRTMSHLSVGVETLTGHPRDRYLSGELVFDDAIHPDDRDAVMAQIADAIAARTPYLVEYRVECADGSQRWVTERGRAIYDIRGRPRWIDGVVLDVHDRKRAELKIRELAFHDALTGLPNRRLLLDRLEHRLAVGERSTHWGALLFLDLDRFKEVNDRLGHEMGDLLLVEVARRLRAILREGDTVARLGGDEFVVLLDEIGEDRDEALLHTATIAEKIVEELGHPHRLGDHAVTCTSSVGVALFHGPEASPERVLRRADAAMYRAKSAGKNQIVYDDEP